MLIDKREDGGYVTPVECVGDYATFVSRVREDPTVDNGLSLWCVSRQSAQGRGAQRGADRRAARAPAPQEGGLTDGIVHIATRIRASNQSNSVQYCPESPFSPLQFVM